MPTPLFAIGDLHGDLEQSQAALRLLGLVDEAGWAGGNATLVQTGDLVDRGPDSLPLLRYWWDLKTQAHAAGGRVVTLLGNHEALNMEGDLRYVHGRTRPSTNARSPTSWPTPPFIPLPTQ